MQETEATTSVSRRVRSDCMAEWRSRSMSSLISVSFSMIGVGPRDVRLGLVVVVVGDEVLDRVLGEELLELGAELGRQRLVVGHDQRRPLDLLDHVGHREGLAGAGDAEQRLMPLPGLDALDQLRDRRGLHRRSANSRQTSFNSGMVNTDRCDGIEDV